MVKKRETVEELKSKLNRTELLLEINGQVAGLNDLSQILWRVIKFLTQELDADRATLFLNDCETNELYSRVAQGDLVREIRILNSVGIAGAVYQSEVGEIIHDVSKDNRFHHEIDQQTGYKTKNMICCPVKNFAGETIGVIEVLNKNSGRFTKDNLLFVEAAASRAAKSIQNAQNAELYERRRAKEIEFMNTVSDVTTEIDLNRLLKKVMEEAARLLNADRATLFLNDNKSSELFSRAAMGEEIGEIRLPNDAGIAGSVFTSGKTINIQHAYADLRFNPEFDKKTGYFTRSILCVPIRNKKSEVIGCTQVLNKRGGKFTKEDESRLMAFTQQVAISLENAKLFEDVSKSKKYNESMLSSMSNGVITVNEDGIIVTCNKAGLNILNINQGEVVPRPASEFFSGPREWIFKKIESVRETRNPVNIMDVEIMVNGKEKMGIEKISVNLSILPLISEELTGGITNQIDDFMGTLVIFEDISSEKRVKTTMSRYMDPAIADQLLEKGSEIMGGQNTEATILFSDIRGFTSIAEKLGAQGTVELLNQYFGIMVECITEQGGILDKFIGDAIMAAFGLPITFDDDEDRGLKASINMINRLWAWNREREKTGILPLEIGIGLNTDNVVAGNIGSEKRMDYTMIGDGVNLAARLESACKQYNARILISDYTFKKLKGTYRIRYIDDVIVKGKTEAVGIHEVLDYHNDKTFPNLLEVVNYFNQGRKDYKLGNFDKAILSFKNCLKANKNDKLSSTYIDRCEYLIKEKHADWNGIWKMKNK